MKDGKLCISADSHVVESAEFFEPLVKRFGEEAPHVVVADPERGPQLYLGNGQLGLTIAGFLQANVDFTSPEAQAMLKEGYKLARPGCYDVAERIKDQEIDGLDGEVVYPSVLFNVYQIPNRDILNATFSSYNDWVTDYCKEAPDRLFALSTLLTAALDRESAYWTIVAWAIIGRVGFSILQGRPAPAERVLVPVSLVTTSRFPLTLLATALSVAACPSMSVTGSMTRRWLMGYPNLRWPARSGVRPASRSRRTEWIRSACGRP